MASRRDADEVEVLRARVLALHAAQHRVGAGLDRQVQRGNDRGRLGHRRDEAGGEIARVGRHEAQAPESRQRADRAQEIGEILARLRIAERVHGLPEELDLQGSLGEQAAGLVHDVAAAGDCARARACGGRRRRCSSCCSPR